MVLNLFMVLKFLGKNFKNKDFIVWILNDLN
jgi:hypothetical protein